MKDRGMADKLIFFSYALPNDIFRYFFTIGSLNVSDVYIDDFE